MSRKPKKIFRQGDILPQIPQSNPDELTWQQQRDLEIEKIVINIKPLNKKQELFINAILTSVATVAIGPAGTGRTYVSCAVALKMFYDGKVDKIVLCRPQVTCGEKQGFLPGTEQEKLEPFLYPLLDSIGDLVGEKEMGKLIKEESIRFASLELMKGSSFRDSIVLLDEAQNATYEQLKMFLTRAGRNCTLVINGDVSQSDLNTNKNPFEEIIKRTICKRDIMPLIEFTLNDVVRSGFVKEMLEVL